VAAPMIGILARRIDFNDSMDAAVDRRLTFRAYFGLFLNGFNFISTPSCFKYINIRAKLRPLQKSDLFLTTLGIY
jgi:hypothetical protein